MKLIASVLMIAALGSGSAAFAACNYPKPPQKIPDGTTATLKQMLAAQKQFQVYNANIKSYTTCLKRVHDQAIAKAGPKITKKQRARIDKMEIQKNNAAVDAAQAVTARFNEQVRAYQQKHKS